ncbi:hypothetical protein EJB05_57544, partial [Eragrostis curvula]
MAIEGMFTWGGGGVRQGGKGDWRSIHAVAAGGRGPTGRKRAAAVVSGHRRASGRQESASPSRPWGRPSRRALSVHALLDGARAGRNPSIDPSPTLIGIHCSYCLPTNFAGVPPSHETTSFDC